MSRLTPIMASAYLGMRLGSCNFTMSIFNPLAVQTVQVLLSQYFTLHTCVHAGLSFISYILAEVSHGYLLEEDEQMYSEKQRRVSTFMKTPRELEKVNNYYEA